jgi:hypothetical protein
MLIYATILFLYTHSKLLWDFCFTLYKIKTSYSLLKSKYCIYTAACQSQHKSLINQQTPWSRILLEKLMVIHLVKVHHPLWNPKAYKSPLLVHILSHESSRVQPSYPISLRSCHLCLGHHSSLFPSGFPVKTLYTFLIFHRCAVCPTPCYAP